MSLLDLISIALPFGALLSVLLSAVIVISYRLVPGTSVEAAGSLLV
ncbi:MAG: hypothetical protein RLZZ385_870 [Pseudomonadota bacterium]|jgi:hypothetical protein